MISLSSGNWSCGTCSVQEAQMQELHTAVGRPHSSPYIVLTLTCRLNAQCPSPPEHLLLPNLPAGGSELRLGSPQSVTTQLADILTITLVQGTL